MGNSNEAIRNDFVIEAKKKFESLLKENQNREKNILLEEINNRWMSDITQTKFDLNIFIYSTYPIDEKILQYLKQYNKDIFNLKIESILGFSQENSNKLANLCRNDFINNNFKNVIIIPIQSLSYLKQKIELDNKIIFEPFNELDEEQQPFFLIVDDEINDFRKYKFIINIENKEENKNELDYEDFNEKIIENIIRFKRIGYDFEIKFDFNIIDNNMKSLMKEYIKILKVNKEDFEIFINNEIFYQCLYNSENFDISQDNNFEIELRDATERMNVIRLTFIIYNINVNEYNNYYQLFRVQMVEFLFYEYKKDELNNILGRIQYEYLDKRNFNVIRFKNSIKNILFKYISYYNQLNDNLFCNKTNNYPATINIAVMGFNKSGKSSLINAILGEKRCLERKTELNNNYMSQISLKKYPINLYDFPGFKSTNNNYISFKEEIKNIHCILFCINYNDNIVEKELEKGFDIIAKYKIRTFFIITESENNESRIFRLFNIIIKILNNIKSKYNDFEKIFGNDLNYSIIPVLSRNKIINGNTYNSFGLDNLFRILYEYFSTKKININKEIFFDEKKIQEYIKNNELLKGIQPVIKSSQEFKNELTNIFKNLYRKLLLLKAPRYIFNSKEGNNTIINEFMEQVFYLFNYYFNQKNDLEKLQYLNKLRNDKNKIHKEFFELFTIGELVINNFKKDWGNTSLEEKIVFPIITPFYYTLGIL